MSMAEPPQPSDADRSGAADGRGAPQAGLGLLRVTALSVGAAAAIAGATALWAINGEAVFVDRLVTAFANCF